MNTLVRLGIDLLGGFTVRIGSQSLHDSVRRLSKGRSLVKLLALATGRRDRALRQYGHLQSTLAAELYAEPEESSRRLYDAIRAGSFADEQPHQGELPAPRHNPPIALTSFVGRAREVARVKETLSRVHLLTLTGVGGAGKTRLALRAGWDVLGSYNAAGTMAFFQTDHPEAVRNYETCLTLRREMGDEEKVGSVLSNLGLVLKDRGEHERAASLFEESLTIARRWDSKSSAAHALRNLWILAQERGGYERAHLLHEECLVLKRELGEQIGVITTLNNLGPSPWNEGSVSARSLLQESLSLARDLGTKRSASTAL